MSVNLSLNEVRGKKFFGLVRNASAAARRSRREIRSDVFNSGDSKEPNGLDVQSVSPFKLLVLLNLIY